MLLKLFVWNIGGGIIRQETQDPLDFSSYSQSDSSYIVSVIKSHSPDLILLQEAHSDNSSGHAQEIVKALGYSFYYFNSFHESFLEKGKEWGLAIISKYPITQHSFVTFTNPHWTGKGRTEKEVWVTFDNGITTSILEIEKGKTIEIKNLHLFPFHHFNKDPMSTEVKEVRADINKKLQPRDKRCIIAGDFNINSQSMKHFLQPLFATGNLQEIITNEPTQPKGRWFDHIIYQDMIVVSSQVITNALTDHYPLYAEFEV